MRASRSTRWTLKKIAARIRLGHGQGTLADYIPWIGVRDLSSIGTATRLWSPKTGRTMEFLSDIERNTFLVAEFREDFVDYWEQWPLERNWTLWAAAKLGYRHSIYPQSRIPIFMTIDGVLSYSKSGKVARKYIECKSSTALDNLRTREKLAITRMACQRLALPQMVVTEKSYSTQVVQNILWIRFAVRRPFEAELVPGTFDMWPMRMHRHLSTIFASPYADRSMPMSKYCEQFEEQNGLPQGLGLRCIKLLMWQHLVEFNMHTPAPEELTLGALTVRRQDSLTSGARPRVQHA